MSEESSSETATTSSGPGIPLIIGIVVGVLILIGLLSWGGLYYFTKKKKQQQQANKTEHTEYNDYENEYQDEEGDYDDYGRTSPYTGLYNKRDTEGYEQHSKHNKHVTDGYDRRETAGGWDTR
ncbi:hypothetical protein LPJ61_001137 [Coemansia biformis]|uniref:Uncharacterized protein n=1 Tax=Coemansia biformis TaxID=1286918 RepID=A0A9W8CXK2_9FUNG|nr:hypothetical protein LPJ61_001137 [Coemansia biformis]